MTDRGPIRTKPARKAAPPLARFSAEVVESLARVTRYVEPSLAREWPKLVGDDIAALGRPGRLSGRGLGRTLELYAKDGAAAARLQFESEAIRRKINVFLGPGAVGRIAVRQAGGGSGPGGDLGSALGRFRQSVKSRTGRENR